MYIVLLVFSAVVIVISAGFFYQLIGSIVIGVSTPAPADGSTLVAATASTSSKKAKAADVLFEAGIAANQPQLVPHSEHRLPLQPHRVYDRSGLGWSKPFRTARTPGNIAVELHAMLQHAGIKPHTSLVDTPSAASSCAATPCSILKMSPVCYWSIPCVCEEMRRPWTRPSTPNWIAAGKLSRYAVPLQRFGLARLAVTSLLCRSGRTLWPTGRAAGAGGRHVLARD